MKSIRERLASLKPIKLIKKWLGKKDEEMPENIKAAFHMLYKLTNKSMLVYATTSMDNHDKSKKSKTKHKKDLYNRKFKKNRKRFQDELHRLNQIITIMNDNNIDIPPPPETKEK